jgi:hypothetical protein
MKFFFLTLMTPRVSLARGWMEFGREGVMDDSIVQRKRLVGNSDAVDIPKQSEAHKFWDKRYAYLIFVPTEFIPLINH